MAKRTKQSITDRNITRRRFLATVLVGTSSLLLGCNTRAGQQACLSIDPFPAVTLGKTGIKTSLIEFEKPEQIDDYALRVIKKLKAKGC